MKLLLVILITLLSGCHHTQGGWYDLDFPESVNIGMDKTEIQSILGTPSIRSINDNDQWYYIKYDIVQGTSDYIKTGKVCVLNFDDDNKLSKIACGDTDNKQEITFYRGTTPVRGDSKALLQQLFGNLGRWK